MKEDIKSLTYPALCQRLGDLGLKRFRADQVYAWLHKVGVQDFEEMTNLSKDLRSKLDEQFTIPACRIEEKYVSAVDDTVKYLFRLNDGEYVESVVMHYNYGYTICVSSQVGCKMGCTFCASTLAGFQRNLLPAEIESQVHAAQKDLGCRISHIVMMGIGEPLDNYDHTISFLHTVNDPRGLNTSLRNITISTCGLVDRIYDLMEEDLPVTLTLSLHAPNDEIRSRTMPVNARWGMDATLRAMAVYAEKTSRRVSFEYTLIHNVNDRPAHAMELAARLRGMLCHVNLIPVNDVAERGNVRSSQKDIQNFQSILKKQGINATIRRTLGHDINASCGQLRRLKKRGDQIEHGC